MPSIYQLKSRFQNILRPLVENLAARGVTANQVTSMAVLLSFFWGGCMMFFRLHNWPWLLLPVLLFVRMALNAIDGMLAREHNMKSNLGAVLNELGDVLSDTTLYLPFALIPHGAPLAAVIVCTLSVISEMTGVIGVQIGASRRYDGPMGKSDRAFVFGCIGLLLGLGVPAGAWLKLAFFVMALMLVLTIRNRAVKALLEAAGHGS